MAWEHWQMSRSRTAGINPSNMQLKNPMLEIYCLGQAGWMIRQPCTRMPALGDLQHTLSFAAKAPCDSVDPWLPWDPRVHACRTQCLKSIGKMSAMKISLEHMSSPNVGEVQNSSNKWSWPFGVGWWGGGRKFGNFVRHCAFQKLPKLMCFCFQIRL